MDVGRGISAPFKDHEWVQKIGLGGLWGLLIITSPAQVGYEMEYIRSVANGDDRLPDWTDFGNLWVRGFLVSIGFMLYMLPALILIMIGILPMMGAAISGDESLATAGIGSICVTNILAIIWFIGVSLFAYAGMVNFAMSGQFGSMFAFSDIMARIKTPGYYTAWGMSIVISFVAGTVGGILGLTYIGVVLAPWVGFIGALMTSHLLGQWAATAHRTGATLGYPSPTTPLAPPAPPAPYQPPTTPLAPPAPPTSPAPYQPPTTPLAPPAPPAPPAPYEPLTAPPAPPAPPTSPAPYEPLTTPLAPPAPPTSPAPYEPLTAPPAPPAVPAPEAPASPEAPIDPAEHTPPPPNPDE